MEKIELKKIKSEYKKWIEKKYGKNQLYSVNDLINTSLTLFEEIKVNGLASDEEDGDMLLFQYDVDDEFFEFNITRQFIKLNEDEPYQLSMTLFFKPTKCKSYDCWSNEFTNLEKWVEKTKKTEGYKLTEKQTSKKFEIFFEQC